MNIVIAGTHYAVTAALMYLTRAFRNRVDCKVVTVGPYPGLWMPWTKNGAVGVQMPDSYDQMPDIPLQYNGGIQSAPISFIENKLDFKVDLWLDVNAGFYLEGRPQNGIRARFLTDPHTGLREIYNQTTMYYDYTFNPQLQYSYNGEIYLPYAADKIWHKRIPDLERLYDVSLIGNIYHHRVQLMDILSGIYRTFFDLGPAQEDARKIYSQSFIGINWSSMDDLTARVFELMSLGNVPLLNRVPHLDELFEENTHYLGFSSESEAISKIRDIMNNQSEGLKIAKNAEEIIIKNKHTWDDRVQTILETCKLTN